MPAGLPVAARDVSECRICGSTQLEPVLSLGSSPLANALIRPEDAALPEPRFPLDLFRCGSCGLVLLGIVVPPQVLYANYPYRSSASRPLLAHFSEYADELSRRFLRPGDLVVEIGSNDGILLGPLAAAGARVLGVEPATNIAARANAAGLETWNEFFAPSVAALIVDAKGTATAVAANNVFAHINDLHGTLAAIDRLLAPDGVLVIEVPYLIDMLDGLAYDTIYHEHLSYYALSPLCRLFADEGFEVFDVQRLALHGGSLRVFVGRRDKHARSASVDALVESERTVLGDSDYYARFARRVGESRVALRSLIGEVVASGRSIAGLGATAKSTTLLNYCGLGRREVRYIADTTPEKQGLLTPGTHIPIRPERTIGDENPDFVVLFAWNYADAILSRYSEYLKSGGRFIHPLPLARIIGE